MNKRIFETFSLGKKFELEKIWRNQTGTNTQHSCQ